MFLLSPLLKVTEIRDLANPTLTVSPTQVSNVPVSLSVQKGLFLDELFRLNISQPIRNADIYKVKKAQQEVEP